MCGHTPYFPEEARVCDWSEAEELSGRRQFDAWRFACVDRTVPWDWADIGDSEKGLWIERARSDAGKQGSPEPPAP